MRSSLKGSDERAVARLLDDDDIDAMIAKAEVEALEDDDETEEDDDAGLD
jgi:hypothetical protein